MEKKPSRSPTTGANAARQLELTVLAFREQLQESLCLNAASNIMSPATRQLLGTALADATMGSPPYAAGPQLDAQALGPIESLTRQLLEELFEAPHAELRPLSGSTANAAVLFGLTRPGDTVMLPPRWAFGHKSLQRTGLAGHSNLTLMDIPWDGERLQPDLPAFRDAARRLRPALIILGTSRTLFPEAHAAVAEIAAEVGARAVYDAAHLLGLIAGGAFPNPLLHGFHALMGSTHKTLPGPLGGVILCREQEAYDRISKLCDSVFASYGANRIASFTQTLLEMREHGTAYAAGIVTNARALAAALADEGFEVVGEENGYTGTHQVLVDLTGVLSAGETHTRLAEVGITCNRPATIDARLRHGQGEGWWLRLGTSCVTRLGMQEPAMRAIASSLRALLIERRPPYEIRPAIRQLVEYHPTVHFTLAQEFLSDAR